MTWYGSVRQRYQPPNHERPMPAPVVRQAHPSHRTARAFRVRANAGMAAVLRPQAGNGPGGAG